MVEPMEMGHVVGDVVQILLSEPGSLKQLGFETQELVVQVVGIDEFGIWAAHPQYLVVRVNDREGRPLPPEKQEHKRIDAHFLIRWEQIATIVHFPDRKGFDFPDPREKHIGFVVDNKAQGEAD